MPAEHGSPLRFGGWTPEELRETFRDSSGAVSDHGVDAVIRFVRGVAHLVRRREAVDNDRSDPRAISIFLLAPDPPQHVEFERDPLLYKGQTSLAGKIWCVNAPVIMGWGTDLETTDADESFLTVTDILELGDCPAILVDPRLEIPEVDYYPDGLASPDKCLPVRLHTTDVDIHRLSGVVERVYQRFLKTPSAQPQANRLWEKPSKHIPHQRAEHKIQALLLPAFVEAFATCRVWDEFAGTMGRADIHIAEHDPLEHSRVTHLAVLELKVLRSFSKEGQPYSVNRTQNWVEDGIKQAGVYRAEHGHRIAALFCFDMRKEDTGETCFEPFRELADTKGVALRRWYLFASSKLARNA